uniref:Putative secreted protein n=1 Tax=Anopheles darlingi TaxID=43151 RepID=A0A2M4D487_ANODA
MFANRALQQPRILLLLDGCLGSVHRDDVFYNVPVYVTCQIGTENLVPVVGAVSVLGQWYYRTIHFTGQHQAANGHVRSRVVKYLGAHVEILQKRSGRWSDRHRCPLLHTEQISQRTHVVKHVLVRMVNCHVELEHTTNEQLRLDNRIPHRPILIGQLQYLATAVDGAIRDVNHIAFADLILLHFTRHVQARASDHVGVVLVRADFFEKPMEHGSGQCRR